mmetsp:Transcript_47624/g.113369  ORF Transcript_47624/g.113369 Transcript_47624/m.113369 type:complete len:359 (+) Transcript_47624:123-1199(+)
MRLRFGRIRLGGDALLLQLLEVSRRRAQLRLRGGQVRLLLRQSLGLLLLLLLQVGRVALLAGHVRLGVRGEGLELRAALRLRGRGLRLQAREVPKQRLQQPQHRRRTRAPGASLGLGALVQLQEGALGENVLQQAQRLRHRLLRLLRLLQGRLVLLLLRLAQAQGLRQRPAQPRDLCGDGGDLLRELCQRGVQLIDLRRQALHRRALVLPRAVVAPQLALAERLVLDLGRLLGFQGGEVLLQDLLDPRHVGPLLARPLQCQVQLRARVQRPQRGLQLRRSRSRSRMSHRRHRQSVWNCRQGCKPLQSKCRRMDSRVRLCTSLRTARTCKRRCQRGRALGRSFRCSSKRHRPCIPRRRG